MTPRDVSPRTQSRHPHTVYLIERSELSEGVATTNLPFRMDEGLSRAALCRAVVDRLRFNAHIVETGTESWRFKKTVERQRRKGVRLEAG